MAVRYEGYLKDGVKIDDLEIIDEIIPKGSKEPKMGKLSTLLEWHTQDPVDNWERRRNHIIYSKYQGNRNPFIDFPEFADKIWGN
jgi:endonuclease I